MRDAETKVYSAEFLTDSFEKERRKSERFRRPLSLVFLTIDNHAHLIEQTWETIVSAELTELVRAIHKLLRGSDIMGRISQDRFCILLPETDGFGTMLALRRLRDKALETGKFRHLGKDFALETNLVSVTFPRDGRDFGELSGAAEGKLIRQRQGPLHRLRLLERPFWEAFDLLADKSAHADTERNMDDVPKFLSSRDDFGRNSHFSFSREMFFRLLESVAQDLSSPANTRGRLIVGGPRPEIFRQIFLAFGSQFSARPNICILGRRGGVRSDAGNIIFADAGDEYLNERKLLLYMKEDGAYGVFARIRDDNLHGFNTVEEWIVNSMTEKIQDAYFPQEGF